MFWLDISHVVRSSSNPPQAETPELSSVPGVDFASLWWFLTWHWLASSRTEDTEPEISVMVVTNRAILAWTSRSCCRSWLFSTRKASIVSHGGLLFESAFSRSSFKYAACRRRKACCDRRFRSLLQIQWSAVELFKLSSNGVKPFVIVERFFRRLMAHSALRCYSSSNVVVQGSVGDCQGPPV